MHQAYCNIFTRLGLNFRPVQADTGSIGGTGSHEFHVLAESGEDDIAFSDSSDYAANIEKAEAIPRETVRGAATEALRLIDTPNAKTIDELVSQFDLAIEKTVKTLVVHAAEEGKLIALIIRGDHELNEIKAANHELVASPQVFASEAEIRAAERHLGDLPPGPLVLPLYGNLAFDAQKAAIAPPPPGVRRIRAASTICATSSTRPPMRPGAACAAILA